MLERYSIEKNEEHTETMLGRGVSGRETKGGKQRALEKKGWEGGTKAGAKGQKQRKKERNGDLDHQGKMYA